MRVSVPTQLAVTAETPARGTTPDVLTPPAEHRWLRPGWPLAAIFVPFPIWWAMGMAEFACLLFAVPMALDLLRRRRVLAPRGFGWWLLFLGWVAIGLTVLHVDALGAVSDANGSRYFTWAYRLVWYLAITVVLLYVLNNRAELSVRRITRIMSAMFLTVTAGGLLGVLAPHLEFTSLVEAFLPGSLRSSQFVSDLVHPSAAQLQQVLGFESPRPSAPFTYSNIWGLNYACFLPFFLFAWCGKDAGWRRFVAPFVLLSGAVPVIYSINRGMWAALIVVAVFVALRSALFGKPGLFAVAIVAGVAVVALVSFTSLGDVVQARFSNTGSLSVRQNLGTLSVTSVAQTSPIIGLGSTRNVQGNFNSITGGATLDCPRCSPPALGTQGQLWLVVFTQGLVGLLLYLVFFLTFLFRYLWKPSPVMTMGLSVLIVSFVTMPVYNALGTALLAVMVAIALMCREGESPEQGAEAAGRADSFGETKDIRPLTAYVRPIGEHLGLVLVCALLGVGSGVLWQQHFGTPAVATATVVLPNAVGLPTPNDGPMNMDTQAQLLTSGGVEKAVLAATGQRLSPDQKSLTLTAAPNTRVVHVIFEADSAPVAVKGVDAAARVFVAERQKQMDDDKASAIRALNKSALALDKSLATVNKALTLVEGKQPTAIPFAETYNLKQKREALLGQMKQLNQQLTGAIASPVRGGVSIRPVVVTPQKDVWRVSIASALMLWLLLGTVLSVARDRNGVRLRSPSRVLRETGLPVLADMRPTGRLGSTRIRRRSATWAMRLLGVRGAGAAPQGAAATGSPERAMSLYQASGALPVDVGDRRAVALAAALDGCVARRGPGSPDRFEAPWVRGGSGAPLLQPGSRPKTVLVASLATRAHDVVRMRQTLGHVGTDVVGVILTGN